MILHGFTWFLMILHPQKLFDKAKSSIPKSITMLRDHDKHDLKVFLRSRSILIILVDAATLSYHQLPPKSHESHLGPSSPESFMDIHRIFWSEVEPDGYGVHMGAANFGGMGLCRLCKLAHHRCAHHAIAAIVKKIIPMSHIIWYSMIILINTGMTIIPWTFSPQNRSPWGRTNKDHQRHKVEPTGVCIHSLPSWKDDEADRMCGFNCTRHLHLLLECVHYIYHISYIIIYYILYIIDYIL